MGNSREVNTAVSPYYYVELTSSPQAAIGNDDWLVDPDLVIHAAFDEILLDIRQTFLMD
jgi:hypothetical protein